MNVRISKSYLLMAAAQEPAAKDEKVPAAKSPEATVTTVHKYLFYRDGEMDEHMDYLVFLLSCLFVFVDYSRSRSLYLVL